MKWIVATVCTAVVVLFAQPAISLLDADCPSIETKKETFKGKGKARYWYRTDPAADPCKLLVFLGVGTAMSVDDYHKIAHSVLAHNTDMTVIFGDANPGWPAKYDAEKYRGLVNHVYESVADIVE